MGHQEKEMISILIPVGGAIIAAIAAELNRPDQKTTEGYGAVPPAPASMAPSANVLRSASLATPGSWTQRNILQAGAQSAYARRLSGNATEADFAVLRAARPGIASSRSGPISSAWSGSPWNTGAIQGPSGGLFSEFLEDDAIDNIGEEVADQF